MASANQSKPASLGKYRNPYERLRAPGADEARQIAELRAAGTLTHQAYDELRRDCRAALSLAVANHRERVRGLAWEVMRAGRTAPAHWQADFRARARGSLLVLSLVFLLAAEVTANDYPHDLPFHPDDEELAEAINRNFSAVLQVVKERIQTGALPVRPELGIQLDCNAEPAVLAWCNDPASISPPGMLCATLDDARVLAQAIGLNPPRELVGESAPLTEQPAEFEAPFKPLEPTGTPNDIEDDRRPTAAASHSAPIARKPDKRQQGESQFIDLRKQGFSEREAMKKVHERFGDKGLSRSSLQRAWKEASHQRAPTALEQLSEAAAKN